MAIWDRLFGKKDSGPVARNATPPATEAAAEPVVQDDAEPDLEDEEPEDDDPVFQATFDARDRHWRSVGQLESDVLAHALSPGFMGGPAWPTLRQAFAVIRRGPSIILATDGMGDPFQDDEPTEDGRMFNGFEHELFIETADIPTAMAGAPGNVGRLHETWAFTLLYEVAQQVASEGGVMGYIEDYGSICREFADVASEETFASQVPARFFDEYGGLGVLIGAPKPDFPDVIRDMPRSPVTLVPVVLLTATELKFCREGRREARDEVARRLAALPCGHRCDLTRPSVA